MSNVFFVKYKKQKIESELLDHMSVSARTDQFLKVLIQTWFYSEVYYNSID